MRRIFELKQVERDFVDWIVDTLHDHGDLSYYTENIMYQIIKNHDPEHKPLEHEVFTSIEELDSSMSCRELDNTAIKNFLHFAYYDGYTDGEILLIIKQLEFLREIRKWNLYYVKVTVQSYSECKRLDRKIKKLEKKKEKN